MPGTANATDSIIASAMSMRSVRISGPILIHGNLHCSAVTVKSGPCTKLTYPLGGDSIRPL